MPAPCGAWPLPTRYCAQVINTTPSTFTYLDPPAPGWVSKGYRASLRTIAPVSGLRTTVLRRQPVQVTLPRSSCDLLPSTPPRTLSTPFSLPSPRPSPAKPPFIGVRPASRLDWSCIGITSALGPVLTAPAGLTQLAGSSSRHLQKVDPTRPISTDPLPDPFQPPQSAFQVHPLVHSLVRGPSTPCRRCIGPPWACARIVQLVCQPVTLVWPLPPDGFCGIFWTRFAAFFDIWYRLSAPAPDQIRCIFGVTSSGFAAFSVIFGLFSSASILPPGTRSAHFGAPFALIGAFSSLSSPR